MRCVSAVFLRIRASLWVAGEISRDKNTLSLRVRHVNDQSLQASQEHQIQFRFTASDRVACSDANRGYPRGMAWQGIITLEPGKRGGRPCVRHMRITVADVLGWLAAGMTHEEILSDYPELVEEDIRACLSYAADRERGVLIAA
jgi:uncharacterized protein (DUF433 family)